MGTSPLQTIVSDCKSVAWDWTSNGWKGVVDQLGLSEKGRRDVGPYGRIDYSGSYGVRISARLLRGSLIALNFILNYRPEVESSGQNDLQIVAAEDDLRFRSYLAEAAVVLGNPAFFGGHGDDGFPADQSADWVAMWNFESARLMLQQETAGPAGPVVVSIVVAPRLLS